jgi:ribonucleotide reductase beta subunit family protein with ferritin-like domain
MFPIKDNTIWQMVKSRSTASGSQEVDTSKDVEDWNRLSDDERHFISMVLAFFRPATDLIENLAVRFMGESSARRGEGRYGFQTAMENIHRRYSILIDTYIKDSVERDRLFHAIENFRASRRRTGARR